MNDSALEITRVLRDEKQMALFAVQLKQWLINELVPIEESASDFTESRARAVLRGADAVDDATLQDFASLTESGSATRVAFYDLIRESGLVEHADVSALAISATTGSENTVHDYQTSISWLSLAIAVYAWKSGYPLVHLDPASPPEPYSPAGQVLKRTAQFIRKQVQRSATERDKLDQKLNQPPSEVPTLEDLRPSDAPVAPLPPYYRPPVPETYPEVATEVLQVDPADEIATPSVTFGEPLVITEEEVSGSSQSETEPVRQPPITISPDQVQAEASSPPSPLPSTAVVMPNSTMQSRPSFTMALRQMLGQEELTSTKLRVLAQRHPDGPGLYGLQVRVTCRGIKSYVAGTTDRDGKFVCELPVRMNSGLTYDVDLTWPRDAGGDIERKSITLNADRTEFTLPFSRQLEAPTAL